MSFNQQVPYGNSSQNYFSKEPPLRPTTVLSDQLSQHLGNLPEGYAIAYLPISNFKNTRSDTRAPVIRQTQYINIEAEKNDNYGLRHSYNHPLESIIPPLSLNPSRKITIKKQEMGVQTHHPNPSMNSVNRGKISYLLDNENKMSLSSFESPRKNNIDVNQSIY